VSPANWPQEGPSPIGSATQINLREDVTGAVHRLLVDPASATTVYAGSVNGGIWKSSNTDVILGADGGTPQRPHWETHSDSLPSLTVGAMAMDPLVSLHIAVGTGARSNGLPPGAEGLVYTTSDGGNTWDPPIDDLLLRGKSIRGITVRDQLILVGAVFGNQGFIFRSNSGGRPPSGGGAAWTRISGGTTGIPSTTGPVLDLIADPSNPDRYYAIAFDTGSGGSGVYLGTSGGTSWTRVSDNDPNGLAKVLQFAGGGINAKLAAGPTGALYVAVGAVDQLAYVSYTKNQGQSWTAMELPTKAFTQPAPTTPPAPPPPAVPPPTKTNIASVVRGVVPGGSNTTILVTSSAAHNLGTGSCRVRILGVTGLPDGDWTARAYAAPVDGGVGSPSSTKFTLSSPISGADGADGMGNTTPINSLNQGTWQCWEGPSEVHQVGNNLALAVDPTNPNIVYVGGDGGLLHLARGNSTSPATQLIPSPQWTPLVGPGASDGRDVHTDIRDMVLDPGGKYLYMSEDGGVFVRTNPRDATGTWFSIAGDMNTVEFRSIALDPLSHALIGGAQDNGTPTEPTGSTGNQLPWQQIEFADGVGVAAVDGHTTDAMGRSISYRYTSFQGSNDFELHTFDQNGTKLSTDYLINPSDPTQSKLVVGTVMADGGTVTQHLNDVDKFDWVPTIGVNRVWDPNAVPLLTTPRWLLIPAGMGVWESRDLGATVKLIAGSPPGVRGISYGHSTNIFALWVTGESGGTVSVFTRFADGVAMQQQTTFPSTGNGATSVAMTTSDPNIAYVTAEKQVFKVTHGGSVPPMDVTGDLSFLTNGPFQGPGRLRSIVYVPSATTGDRIIVAASDGGVPGVFMMAVDNPGVWMRLGVNLPNANPWALDYEPGQQMLVVGTAGRGAWSLKGVTGLDRAPKALCKNVTLNVDATCKATTTAAAFNNGSTDPDGNPFTFTAVDPATAQPIPFGPFSPQVSQVTISVADNQGAAALCTPTLTVRDVTPPVLQVPAAKTVNSCAASTTVAVGQASATDNCATGLVPTAQVVAKNGVALSPPIPVVNGQVSLAPGTYTVTWSVSDGANPPVTGNQTVTIGAGIEVSQSFLLDDRAQLRNTSGGFAAVLNAGTGTTRLGQTCTTGGIISKGPVTIQHRSVVNGNVISGGKVTKDTDATVNGVTTENASVQLPALPTLPAFPPATLPGFTVNPGPPQTKSPGSYASATIINGATLVLLSGDYYFQSLTMNAGAIVRVTPTTRVFVANSLVFSAPFVGSSGSTVQPIFLGFAGAGPTSMTAVFNGTFVAPNATVTFGTGAGLTYTGSFFGRSFEITPGSAFVCSVQ